LTTKVHLVVDALGLPLAFKITEGHRHDSSYAFRAFLDEMNCQPVIPSSSSWIDPPAHDKDLYKARAEVECTFSLLKQARRFATRYEKTVRNYAAVVAIGCALLWLRI
jgi:transposase